jgi:hypothetical protein
MLRFGQLLYHESGQAADRSYAEASAAEHLPPARSSSWLHLSSGADLFPVRRNGVEQRDEVRRRDDGHTGGVDIRRERDPGQSGIAASVNERPDTGKVCQVARGRDGGAFGGTGGCCGRAAGAVRATATQMANRLNKDKCQGISTTVSNGEYESATLAKSGLTKRATLGEFPPGEH